MALTQELIERIRSGSIAAFEILFKEYYAQVRSFALGFLKNELDRRYCQIMLFAALIPARKPVEKAVWRL